MILRCDFAPNPLRHSRITTAPRILGVLAIWVMAVAWQPCTAQIITGVAKEHARHLWYVSYVNDFGIGYVEWQYGELNVLSNVSTFPVYLELTADEWHSEGASSRRTGSPLRGPDIEIGRQGRSRAFSYAPGSQLSFYRHWHAVNTDTTSHRPSPEVVALQRSWADVRWTVSPGMITDTMLVALWLVDAITGQHLIQLDSVGVLGSTSDAIATRVGSRPDLSIHSVVLPDRYAGRKVCVQPIPYRYGPTPFGLFFIKRFSTFNMSVLFEREEQETFPGPLPRSEDYLFSERIDSAYGHDLRMYYAESFLQDSCPPALMCLYSLDQKQLDALNTFLASLRIRRNDPRCAKRASADTAWWVSTLVEGSNAGSALSSASIAASPSDLTIRNVNTNGCMISLRNVKSPRCTYRILSPTGHPIAVGVIGPAPFTDHELTYSLGGWQAAVVVVQLADGTVLSAPIRKTWSNSDLGR